MRAMRHRVALLAKPLAAAVESASPDGTVRAAAFVPAMGRVRITGKNSITLDYDVGQSGHRELVRQLQALGWEPRYRPDLAITPSLHDLMEANLLDQAQNLPTWETRLRYAHFICGEEARQRLPHRKLWQRHNKKKQG